MYKMGLLTGATHQERQHRRPDNAAQPPRRRRDIRHYGAPVDGLSGAAALPFVDSKGNFGKVYSRDMSYAASRYTEAKLAADLRRDIPGHRQGAPWTLWTTTTAACRSRALLPTAFPNVLVSANLGIAVGMASQVCGFNLNEVCETTIAWLRDPEHDHASPLCLRPDFPTGGEIVYDRSRLWKSIYQYRTRQRQGARPAGGYLPKENIIEIYEIPYTATTEAIIDKVAELIKAGKVREINDMRDETDLSGLKTRHRPQTRRLIPDKLMQKLFRLTTLQDSFSLQLQHPRRQAVPRVMGVAEILEEWTAWRTECVRRRVYFELAEEEREAASACRVFERILLDIDKRDCDHPRRRSWRRRSCPT